MKKKYTNNNGIIFSVSLNHCLGHRLLKMLSVILFPNVIQDIIHVTVLYMVKVQEIMTKLGHVVYLFCRSTETLLALSA